MSTPITIDQFTRFVAEFTAKLGFTLVDKEAALEMQVAAFALDVLGVIPRKTFVENMATTIGTVVYVPSSWDLDKKVRVLVHEATHVLQYAPLPDPSGEAVLDAAAHAALAARFPALATTLPLVKTRLRVSGLAFAWLYLTEPEERARFEAEAYAAGMELEAMRTGSTPKLEDVGHSLCCAYALPEPEQAFARTILRSRRVECQEALQAQAMGKPATWRSTAAITALGILRGIHPSLIASA